MNTGRENAFTLLEMIVVMGISALMLAILIPAYQYFTADQAAYTSAKILASDLLKQKELALQLEQNAGVMFTSSTAYNLVTYPGNAPTTLSTQNLSTMRSQISFSPAKGLPYVIAFTPGGNLADPSSPSNPAGNFSPTSLSTPQITSSGVTFQVLVYLDPSNVNLPSQTVTVKRKP